MQKFFLSALFLNACLSLKAQHANFDKYVAIKVDGSSFNYVGTGDVDGDGRTDIAGCGTQLFLWRQGSSGQLPTPVKYLFPKQGSVSALAVADIFKDGKAEVLVGIGGQLCIYSWVNNGLVLTDSFTTVTNSSHNGITTADFDGDGLTDIGLAHWGGYRVTVAYQKGEGVDWDIRHYPHPTNGFGHVAATKFGSLQQNALVVMNWNSTDYLKLLTFTPARALQNSYDFQLNAIPYLIHGAATVRKGPQNKPELWVAYGGNRPNSKVAIWRDIQSTPDSIFDTYDIPEAVQADNLDCDDDDEAVVLHGGWMRTTVYSDTSRANQIPYSSHYQPDGLAIGDINSDGRKDICIASYPNDLIILYNISRPCLPTSMSVNNADHKGLSIYPNPASNQFAISSDRRGIINIHTLHGHQVYSGISNARIEVDCGAWVPGLYFITLHDNDGNIETLKFYKQ